MNSIYWCYYIYHVFSFIYIFHYNIRNSPLFYDLNIIEFSFTYSYDIKFIFKIQLCFSLKNYYFQYSLV